MFRQEDFENEEKLMAQQDQDGDQADTREIVPAQSEDYKSFLLRYNQNIFGPIDYMSDGTFQIINDFYAVAYISSSEIGEMEVNSYTYNSIPKCYTYMDVESLRASGVTQLHNHPYLKLRGKGTLVAVIDTGVDYRNELFRNGTKTKILDIWDQTVPGGMSERAPYGRVYGKEEIEKALESEDPLGIVPSMDTNGHGTMLAAVAAGNIDEAQNFSGAAPEAYLIVVKLKPAKKYLREFYLLPPDAEVVQEDDIMLAISFATKCAQRYHMPLSICLGVGTNQGSHEGFSPLSQLIDYTAGFTQNSISIAAGNEGDARHHYEGNLDRSRPSDTAELRVGENSGGFTMEFWGSSPEQFQISVQSPTGEVLPVSTALRGDTQELVFVFVETRVMVNYIPIERQAGNTLVYFRFLHPAAGIWKLNISGRDFNVSQFHIWLPARGMIEEDTFFLQSSPYTTITAPGDARDGMTVTAYRYQDGSLFQQASRGFSPGGTVKPNFAAPGVGIKVPLLNGGYGLASGTSLAAAQTAGVAALLFEWAVIRGNEPYFSGNSVKNYLQRGAIREENLQYPNPEWGYGKIDLYHTFELLT